MLGGDEARGDEEPERTAKAKRKAPNTCHSRRMARLASYRQLVARLNPTATPQESIGPGRYVARTEGSLGERLARRMSLGPSAQLVVGAIGTGKTTELMRAVATAEHATSEHCDYIHYVSVIEDIGDSDSVGRGSLVACAARELAHLAGPAAESEPDVADAVQTLEAFISDNGSNRPGNWDFRQDLVRPLRKLRERVLQPDAHVSFAFDSLDRLSPPARFFAAVEDDLKTLRAAGIGVVLVGPIRIAYAQERAFSELFDEVHFFAPADPATEDGRLFLRGMLTSRDDERIIPDGIADALVQASGGVLRDLLSLAKRTAEEAYVQGHEPMLAADAERAIDTFARSLAFGLDDSDVAILRKLAESGAFVIRGERELTLIETRRVLTYANNRWAVHPTLRPLLEQIPGVA
ncbi:MAG: hypothetical protein ACHREM_11495 [Polyangiales bacterium]